MTQDARCQLLLPPSDKLYEYIRSNAVHATRMAQQNTHVGKTLAICGAGPSLAVEAATMRTTDDVWACNGAVNYLQQHGHRVTHGFAIDQGEAMLGVHEWATTYDMPYYVASSVHPKLVAHLLADGRDLTFFHSYLGLDDPEDWVRNPERPNVTYEMALYTSVYASSVQVGFGLNAVPRAICLALFLGYSEIHVYGADCACAPNSPPMPSLDTPAYAAWLAQLQMYADGRCAITYGAEAVMAEATIDGVRWHTRPDMAVSAVHMADMCRQYSQITLHGNTLPQAFLRQPPEFAQHLPRLENVGEVHGFGHALPLPDEDVVYAPV